MKISRRVLLIFSLFFIPKIRLAQQPKTPWQPKGPFYPIFKKNYFENNLIKINKKHVHALGDKLKINGTLSNLKNEKYSNMIVEIWQTDRTYTEEDSF